jgi:hypothetical protein
MSYKRKYQDRDPKQLQVRYPGKCRTCGISLPKGVNAFYWPSSKSLYCIACGDQPYREFLSSVGDEEVYNGNGNGNPFYM